LIYLYETQTQKIYTRVGKFTQFECFINCLWIRYVQL